ncbi:hypothetical protein CHELA1G11_12963 [Hyphomicrobiales bacterium]|nr:conserved hypothetical protein [Hyphomicrobiales bacterium]CAH1668350.1 hypothetical protein CHELA1G11_12963 [Hyphomicrobiales bacterium]
MSNLIELRPAPKPDQVVHLSHVKTFTDYHDADFIVDLARDEEAGTLHVIVRAGGNFEPVAGFSDTEVGRLIADAVGDAVDRAIAATSFLEEDSQ